MQHGRRITRPTERAKSTRGANTMPVDHVQRAAGVSQSLCINLQHDGHTQTVPPYRCRDVLQHDVIYRSAQATASEQRRRANDARGRPKHRLDRMGVDGTRGARVGKQ